MVKTLALLCSIFAASIAVAQTYQHPPEETRKTLDAPAPAEDSVDPSVEKPKNAADVPVQQLTWAEFDAADEHPFKTWLHPDAPESVATSCAWQLSAAQWTQDIVAADHSEAHFDNCAFDAAVDFINDRLRAADAAVKARLFADAMYDLGQALHAIQDFYAHSNYIELMAQAHPHDVASAKTIAFWQKDGVKLLRDLRSTGLVSGRVSYSIASGKRCSASGPTHEDIAKDSASFSAHAKTVIPGWGNRTYFVAALDAATAATQDFLRYSFTRWPDLGRACGKPVGYLTVVERRPLQ
jgi:hypothetical protein